MNRKFNIMIAAAMTVMTLSACSNGGTSTTAAPGTTSPGTSPATTAITTQPVTTTPATSPSTTTASTMPPATTTASTMPPATTSAGQTGVHTSDVANVYIKSAEAMAALDSFRITTETELDVAGTKMTTKGMMDMFPKDKKSKITSDFAGQSTVMYLMDNKMYMNMADTWMYFVADDVDPGDLEAVEQAQKVTDAEYMDMFTYEKTATGYQIKTKRPLTTADFEKLGSQPGSTATPNPLEPVEEPLDMTYEMEMNINNEYYATDTEMKITTIIEGKTSVTEMKMTYSEFNSVPAIELPAEALNAKEFTMPGMPSTTP